VEAFGWLLSFKPIGIIERSQMSAMCVADVWLGFDNFDENLDS
jgi:hypothetical protein